MKKTAPNEKAKKASPRQSAGDEARRILRRLQGEDGYDVFADRQPGSERDRRDDERGRY